MPALIQVKDILPSVVNCDLISNKNSTVIKFETRNANVLSAVITYHIVKVFIVESHPSINLKN
jgi:hypothetical protein